MRRRLLAVPGGRHARAGAARRALGRAALALALGTSPLAAQPSAGGRTVRVPGAELWYREQGAGEPLVLLHGFLDCAAAKP